MILFHFLFLINSTISSNSLKLAQFHLFRALSHLSPLPLQTALSLLSPLGTHTKLYENMNTEEWMDKKELMD